MKTNLMNAIEIFAKLDLNILTDNLMKGVFIEIYAEALDLTPNRFIEIMKNEIKAIKSEELASQMTFETAIYRATLETALFNARRCYHARRALRYEWFGIALAA